MTLVDLVGSVSVRFRASRAPESYQISKESAGPARQGQGRVRRKNTFVDAREEHCRQEVTSFIRVDADGPVQMDSSEILFDKSL